MKSINFIMAGTILLCTLSLQSCKKETGDEEDSDISLAENASSFDKIFGDAADIADEAAITSGVSKSENASVGQFTTSTCATITKDTSLKQITIDFGTTNCLCKDQVNRRGQILVNYTKHYRDSGSVRNITFNEYYVNDNKVSGNKIVTNKGRNAKGNLEFDIIVDGGLVLAEDAGKIITNKANRTREWIAGEATKDDVTDDKYSITGSSSGTKQWDITYTTTIIEPLIKDLSCTYKTFTQGKIEVKVEGKKTRTIDYGQGDCDKLAKVTIGNKTYNTTTR